MGSLLLFATGCDLTIPDNLSISTDDASATLNPGEDCVDLDNDGICASSDCDDGNAQKGQAEVCDGIDNDCDDLIDEGFDVGAACSGLTAGGCQRAGLRACSSGISVCIVGEGPPEACNGLDDDCDGVPDEGNPGGGGPCDGGGLGACAGGAFQCIAGALGCVATTTAGALAETCNRVDDDCDGVVDEQSGGTEGPLGIAMTESCYFGPAGTGGKGICQDGTWTCVQGQWTACQGEVRPRGRQCNGLDNDCNGVVDDDEQLTTTECTNQCGYTMGEANPVDPDCYAGPIGTDGTGLCARGERACLPGNTWGACTDIRPTTESCNGLDDDCDGQEDEGILLDELALGAACSLGLGACQAAGIVVCAGDELTAVCNATPGTPTAETCDGLDNDCDGRIDEVAGVGSACTRGDGPCERPGVLVCDQGSMAFACNAPVVAGVAERCNDIDDDCDGLVDETFDDLDEVCSVGVGACVRSGTYVCSLATAELICDVQPGGPSAEICDGLDNNCDGSVDEGFGVGNACNAPGICGAGVLECTPVGQTRCSTGPSGSASLAVQELCNELDDDCDGLVDENFSYSLGQSCYGCQLAGLFECAADGVGIICSTSAGGSATPSEICSDTYDNDCDGQYDEASCITP